MLYIISRSGSRVAHRSAVPSSALPVLWIRKASSIDDIVRFNLILILIVWMGGGAQIEEGA